MDPITGTQAPPQPITKWAWVTVLLLSLFFTSTLVTLRNAALLGVVTSGYPTARWVCWLLAVGLGAFGVAGLILTSAPRPPRPSPRPPEKGSDLLTIGWDPTAGWLTLSPDAQQRHTLVLGSSGSGKTQLLLSLLAQQIARGGGVLMIDAKVDRSARQSVLALCKITNRLHDLRLIWPEDPSISNTWNPLLRGSIEEIMGRVMALWPTEQRGDPFWREAAQDMIRALLSAMKLVNPYVTFNDLYIALTMADTILWLEAQVTPGTEQSAMLTAFLSNYRTIQGRLNVEQLKKITGGAGLHLSAYAWGDLGKILNSTAPTLDLLEALTMGQIVYVALPILARTEEAVALARMLVADLKQAVGVLQQRTDKPVPPFLVLMDEASAYTNVQGIERLFEQARSANVALVAASQVLSGFEVPNRSTLDFILGNTATKVIMALGDFNSAEMMAKTIGERRVLFESESAMKDRSTSAPWSIPIPNRTNRGHRDTLAGQERYDYTVRPERFLNQATGQAVIFKRDPELGGALYPDARTCLTNIPSDMDISLPIVPCVSPAGLDLLRLIQRGLPTVESKASSAGSTTAKPRARTRRVSQRETPDFVVVEPGPAPDQEG